MQATAKDYRANGLHREIGGWNGDRARVDQAERIAPEDAEHRDHDGTEHHADDGEVGARELTADHACVAEPRALEDHAECDADRDCSGDDGERGHRQAPAPLRALRARSVTRIAVPKAIGMKAQAPVDISAPPESASPLVQP